MNFDLEKIATTLNNSYPFFLSTVNQNKPATRPFGGVAAYKGKLILLTEKDKNLVNQIKENPQVELVGVLPDNNTWIRVGGKASFSEDLDKKQAVLEQAPLLGTFYPQVNNSNLIALEVEVDREENYPQDYEIPNLSSFDSLLFLVRHCQTVGNLNNQITGGNANTPLTEYGRESARKKGEIFKNSGIQAVISSPLSRAKETAELLTESLDLPIIEDDRLKERFLDKLDYSPMFFAPDSVFYHDLPFGEDPQELYKRVDEAIKDIIKTYSGDVLVVSHGAALGNWLAKRFNNDNLALSDNLCCVILDGKTLDFIGLGFDDKALEAILHRYQNK